MTHAPHFCHVPACGVIVPRRMLMCLAHWRMVPKSLQRAVWQQYQSGQEQGRAPVTGAYLDAADAAIRSVQGMGARG